MRTTIKNLSCLIVLALLTAHVYANEDIIEEPYVSTSSLNNLHTCIVPTGIIEIILKMERHAKRPIGYEYIIAFNSQEEASLIRESLGKELFLDWRTIDCKNEKLCTEILSFIAYEKKISNVDLGCFQINLKHHKMASLRDYFSFEKSYYKACNFLENLILTHGYSWETIARYHSSTPKYNYAYLQKISKATKENL